MLRSWLTPDDGKPVLICLAGCNGVGKTSLFNSVAAAMKSPPIFLNADLLALVLKDIPAADVAAQKIAATLQDHMIGQRKTFVMETVFSDPNGAKIALLKRAKATGFHVVFVYVTLADLMLAKARIGHRVKTGGHSVDPNKLPRRWEKSHENAHATFAFVEDGILFDNSSYSDPMRLIAITHNGATVATFGPVPPHFANSLPPVAAST